MDFPLSIKVLTDKGIFFNILYWSIPIVVFYLGLIAYLRDKKGSTNRTFFLFTLLIVTWALITPLYLSPSSKFINLYLARISNALIFWAAPAYYHFCKVFPKKKEKLSITEQIMIGVNVILALITIFSGAVVADVKTLSWGANGINNNFGFIFVTLWFAFYVSLSLSVLIRKLRLVKGRIRAQIQYIILALAILSIWLFPINLLYPLITGQSKYDYYGPLGSIFFIGFSYYAIIKHRLMDIRIVVLKSAVYTTLVGLISGSYILSIYYLKKHYEQAINLDIVFILAILVAAFGFQPLKRILQKYADRLFSKGRYNFEDLLKKISNVLSANLILENLANQFLSTLSNSMKIRKSAFVLGDGFQKGNDFYFKKVEINKLLNIAQFNSALVADELEDDDSKKILMRKLGIEVIIYFADEDKAIGFLALSEKASGDAYSAQDLKLLEIIAPQITIALKNIEQQQQMIEQIVEERQRINQDAHDHIYNRLGALAKKAEIAELNPQGAGETLALLKTDLRIAVDDLQRIVKGETQEEDHDNAFIIEELKKICSDFETQSSIKLDLNCACDILNNLPPKDLWHLQCILEECLNNVRKHSQATQVNVEISKNNGSIIMQVKDNGVGMNRAKRRDLPASLVVNQRRQAGVRGEDKMDEKRDGMGLEGMQGRAKKINGEITFTSNNGHGTTVQLKVPC